jgi:general secretion pathway protein G
VEVFVAMSIIALLAALAIPLYIGYIHRARIGVAVGDIGTIARAAVSHHAEANAFPDSLADIGLDDMLDPWGNPYRYLRIATANMGQMRKDRFLVPINTDFDLYSMGRDGKTSAPITAQSSHDDVLRADDGRFIGLAIDY